MEQRAIGWELPHAFSFSQARTLLLLAGVLALVGLIYLGQSSQATLTGARVLELQAELDRLERANAELEYEIAVLTTPAKLADRARVLGLRPATVSQTIYIVVRDFPVAPKPVRRVAALPPTAFAETAGTWWDAALARLGLSPHGRAVEALTVP